MALQRSLLLQNTNYNQFKIWDRYLTKVIGTISTGSFYILDVAYDKERQKLWILAIQSSTVNYDSRDAFVYQYNITETSIGLNFNKQLNIEYPYNFSGDAYRSCGKFMDILESTGDCFIAAKFNFAAKSTTTTPIIYKITTDNQLTTLALPNNSLHTTNFAGVDLFVNQNNEYVYVFSHGQDYDRQLVAKIDKNLTQYELSSFTSDTHLTYNNTNIFTNANMIQNLNVTSFYNATGGHNGYKYAFFDKFADCYYFMVRPTTKKSPNKLRLLRVDLHNLDNITPIHIGGTPDDLRSYLLLNQKTGYKYIIVATNNTNVKIKKYKPNWEFISEHTNIPKGHFYCYNPHTDEIYVKNYNNRIELYDIDGNFITNAPDNTGDVYNFSLVLPGSNDEPVLNVGTPYIVEPEKNSLTTDKQPTIIFKVGVNPTGWTQQFRVIVDSDYDNIIQNQFNGTYARVCDSWANGQYYKSTWNFEYSNDYNPITETGTWSSLGSGDPLQSGGTHGLNGVDGSSNSVYVRCKIPQSEELTSGQPGVTWYFSVFSVSNTI